MPIDDRWRYGEIIRTFAAQNNLKLLSTFLHEIPDVVLMFTLFIMDNRQAEMPEVAGSCRKLPNIGETCTRRIHVK